MDKEIKTKEKTDKEIKTEEKTDKETEKEKDEKTDKETEKDEKIDKETETDTNIDIKPDIKTDTNIDIKTNTNIDIKPEIDIKKKTEIDIKSEIDIKKKTEIDIKPDTNIDIDIKSEIDIKKKTEKKDEKYKYVLKNLKTGQNPCLIHITHSENFYDLLLKIALEMKFLNLNQRDKYLKLHKKDIAMTLTGAMAKNPSLSISSKKTPATAEKKFHVSSARAVITDTTATTATTANTANTATTATTATTANTANTTNTATHRSSNLKEHRKSNAYKTHQKIKDTKNKRIYRIDLKRNKNKLKKSISKQFAILSDPQKGIESINPGNHKKDKTIKLNSNAKNLRSKNVRGVKDINKVWYRYKKEYQG